ncbi:MAG: hypothetical protein ABI895_28900 [Deltaproteobacteria bacterium]
MAKKARKTPPNSKHLPSWKVWQAEHEALLDKLTPAQKALLEAAVRFVAAVEGEHILVRIAGFFLLHAGMGLSPAQVGAAIGRSDRAMRTVQAHGPRELLDTVPSGYPKQGNPHRPGFRRGPITLCAWMAALAWHALRNLAFSLPKTFHLAHPRTLRRWLLERNAHLLLTNQRLLVVLDSRRGHRWLLPLLRAFNDRKVPLPWLDDRAIAIGFAAPLGTARPRISAVGYEHTISPAGVWC